MNLSAPEIIAALSLFSLQPSKVQWQPLGNGLINQTLLVDDNGDKFVLQQINQQVFPSPNAVVDNAMLINQCLKDRGAA